MAVQWDQFEPETPRSPSSPIDWDAYEPEAGDSVFLSTDVQPRFPEEYGNTPADVARRAAERERGFFQSGPNTFEPIPGIAPPSAFQPTPAQIESAPFRSRVAMSAPGRLLGVGGANERELRREEGFSPAPTVTEIPGMVFQLMTPPPPVQQGVKKVTDPLVDLLPDEAAGVTEGVRDVALQFPWAAGAAGALTRTPKLGAALLAAFAGEYAWQLPDDKAAFDAALAAGRKRDAYRIATTAILSGILLGAGAKHEVGQLRRGTPVVERPFGEADYLDPNQRTARADLAARNLAAPGTVRPQEMEAVGPPSAEPPPMFEAGEMPFESMRRFGTMELRPPQILPSTGFLPEPQWIEETRPKQELETRGKVSFGAEAPTLTRTATEEQAAIRAAEELGLKKAAAAAANAAVEKGPNASSQQEAAAVHGDLRTQPGQGEGPLPPEENSGGIFPREESPGGAAQPANAQTSEVPLRQYLADVAAGKVKTTQEATAFGRTVKTADEIGQLKAAYEQANVDARKVLNELPDNATPEEMQAAINQASRPQFIAEAIEAATGADAVKGKDPAKFRELMDAGQPRERGSKENVPYRRPKAAPTPEDVARREAKASVEQGLTIEQPQSPAEAAPIVEGQYPAEGMPTGTLSRKQRNKIVAEQARGGRLTPPRKSPNPNPPVAEGTYPRKYERSAKEVADFLREWLKTEGDTLGTFGPVPKLINAAVEIAARIIEKGGKIADAIDAAIGHIRANHHGGAFDEPALRAKMEDVLKREVSGAGAAGAPKAPAAPAAVRVDPNKPTAIAQVTDYIAENPPESPNLPLAERISRWVNVAEKWAAGKDAFTRSLAGVRAASAALLDSYLHLPKWDGFEAARGRWSGADNRSGLEVRNFIKEINRAIPNPVRQEAITNWIQAGGDEAVLRQRAEATQDPALRRGYDEALTLTPGEIDIAQNIQGYLEARLQEGLDAGILRQGVDNYVTQIWKEETPATTKMRADLFGGGNLNPSFRFARQRVFASYFDGEQAGFAPRDKRIGTLIGAYELAFNRATSSRAFIKALYEATAADGKPLAMISGKTMPVGTPGEIPEAFLIKPRQTPGEAVTEDGRPYRVVDHWALRDWKWAANGPDGQPVIMQGDMLVHPDYYRDVRNMLSQSALSRNEGLAKYTTRPLLKGSAFLKQSKLSLSGFHLTQEGVHGVFHRVNPGNLVELDMTHPEQRSLVEHGLQIADPRAMELLGEGLIGGGIVTKIPALGPVQAHFNDWLFKDYIPKLKMTMALDALERNRKAYAKDIEAGKITDDQIQALTAREANAAFGEQNYRMMGRNPTVQDFLRLTVLAPDFLESRVRFVAQALKPYGREQQVALGLMGATLFVTARILNKWLDDDPHWDHPFSVIHKGKEYRLRTVLGDVQHLIQDPRMFAYNRLSPAGRTAIETLTTRDDRGIKRSGWEQMQDVASWVLPIPTQTKSDTTPKQQVLASMGIGVRNYGPVQQVYELADKWKKDNTDPRIKEQYETYQRETHADSPYKPLRDAIIKGDEKAAREAMKKLRETRTPAQIRLGLDPRPFTGSAANERKFLQTLDEHQREIYRQAEEERKRIRQEALRLLR